MRRALVISTTCIVGMACLFATVHAPPESTSFYLFSILLASIWVIGAIASGSNAHSRKDSATQSSLLSIAMKGLYVGLALLVASFCGALVLSSLPTFRHHLDQLLDHATNRNYFAVILIAVLNGSAEELFFRDAVQRLFNNNRSWQFSTVIYVAVVCATTNVSLILAAAVLGTCAGLLRHKTGTVVAPIVMHAVWSLGLLILLPSALNWVS